VVGVLNVTPDSFSDGGRWDSRDAAIFRGLELHRHGADIVDVGGESTRPGADRVSVEAEQQRVLPVIEALVADGVVVSIDTLNAGTAAAAVTAGAAYINDVSGGLADPAMASVAAGSGATFIASHWRGHSATMEQSAVYTDVVGDVRRELQRRVDALLQAGLGADRLILDPGLGFAKRAEHNWRLLGSLDDLQALGFPVLVGASRKRFLGELLPEGVPVDDRDLPTAVVSALAARAGVWGVRVHDVPSTRVALRVVAAWDDAGVSTRMSGELASGDPASGEPAGSDRIRLVGLRAHGFHGVFPEERRKGQEFVVDVTAWLDLAPAGRDDDLTRTVHYGELAEQLVAAVERDPVSLIETVAERCAAVVLAYPAVERVEVTIHKPQAPIAVAFSDVAVTVARGRGV
jgi:dihydropteroate synthase